MATLVDRAYLEEPYGAKYIADLLTSGFQASDPQPLKDAQAQARLDSALQEADAFLRRFIDAPLEWTEYVQRDLDNIKPLARRYAIWFLRTTTRSGSNDPQWAEDEKQMTLDAAKLRERGMWTGSTRFQEPTPSEYVESGSSFRRDRMRGLI